MPRPIGILILVLAAVFLLSGTALLILGRVGPGPVSQNPRDPALPDEGLNELAFPPFILTAHDGSTITSDSFTGRVTVVDFFFTHCPFICPTLTQKMRELSRRLDHPSVRFLSISVDPAHDNPAALLAYAERNHADLSRWTFATGDKPTIDRIVRDGLKFALYDDPKAVVKLDDGSTMDNIVHPPFFVLIGPDSRVLGLYPVAAMPESLDQLAARAGALARSVTR